MGKILDDGEDLKNQICLVNERGISENCYNRENKKIDQNLLSEINIHIESYLKDINKNFEDLNLQEIKIEKDKKINNTKKINSNKKKPPDTEIVDLKQTNNSILIIKKKKKKKKKKKNKILQMLQNTEQNVQTESQEITKDDTSYSYKNEISSDFFIDLETQSNLKSSYFRPSKIPINKL